MTILPQHTKEQRDAVATDKRMVHFFKALNGVYEELTTLRQGKKHEQQHDQRISSHRR